MQLEYAFPHQHPPPPCTVCCVAAPVCVRAALSTRPVRHLLAPPSHLPRPGRPRGAAMASQSVHTSRLRHECISAISPARDVVVHGHSAKQIWGCPRCHSYLICWCVALPTKAHPPSDIFVASCASPRIHARVSRSYAEHAALDLKRHGVFTAGGSQVVRWLCRSG